MADDHNYNNCSDESDSDLCSVPELQGNLSKWTNYIHGWQSRFIVLKDGTLSYYKSELDSGFGCRGAISLVKATIKPHEFDECRFDVSVNDCVWYLRADTPEDKQHWVDVLESFKGESGYATGSENSLRRHGSAVSLQSTTLSTASGSSFKRGSRGLREKLNEMETFRDILCNQIDSLQKYFDACAESKDLPHFDLGNGIQGIDFKGEAITFRATTGGVLTTLQHCLDVVGQREEAWRRRLEREFERRKRAEELYKVAREQLERARIATHPGPDYEEGPHSALPEDEFYDAVESSLDKIEEDHELRDRLRVVKAMVKPTTVSKNQPTVSKAIEHRLWPEIDRVSLEQLHYARIGVGEDSSDSTSWQLFAEDGDMKMYRREQEVNGMVLDPLKACHMVRGVTGREMCKYFFSPEYRHDWETTLEQMTVLETIADDTLVFLQTHKRIWPASQRDALFWSHMRHVPDDKDRDGQDIWFVCNHSTEDPAYPQPNTGKCVRVFLTVSLVCQTRITPPKDGAEVTRDDITCKISYCSVVNPGGWAPASVLRAVYKREYPKFLKRFTQYVIDQCKDKSIMF